MLDVTPDKLLDLIKGCQEATRIHIETMEDAVRQMHGAAYRKDRIGAFHPDNIHFQYASHMLPRLVYNQPRVRVTSRGGQAQQTAASAMEHALNRWAHQERLAQCLQAGAVLHMLFNYGVVMVTHEPDPEKLDVPGAGGFDEHGKPKRGQVFMPKARSIHPELFWMDPYAWSMEECRIVGHTWFVDKDDLLDLAEDSPGEGWNVSVIRDLTPGDTKRRGREVAGAPERDELEIHTCWIPEYEDDDHPGSDEGYHGSLFFLAEGGSDPAGGRELIQVREPQPYYGPKTGPYTVYGAYTVPGDPYPLGPLQANCEQIEELNKQTEAQLRADLSYKRLGIVADKGKGLRRRLEKAEGGQLIDVVEFDSSNYAPIEVGGSSEQQQVQVNTARQRLNDALGMSEAIVGNVTGAGTATENSIAAEASLNRTAFLQQRVADCTRDVLEKVAWYFHHSRAVVMALDTPESGGTQFVAAGGPIPTPTFYGGVYDEEADGSFSSLDFEVDIHSMPRMSEATLAQQVVDSDLFLLQAAPLMPQTPWVRWHEYMRWRADRLNTTGMADWIDFDVLEEASQGGAAGQGVHERPQFAPAQRASSQGSARPSSNFPTGRQAGSPAGPRSTAGEATTARQPAGVQAG